MVIQHFNSSGQHYPTNQNFATSEYTNFGNLKFVAGSAGNSQLGQSTGMTCEAPMVRVYPGDYFVLSMGHSSGGVGQTVEEGAQFYLEVVEGL